MTRLHTYLCRRHRACHRSSRECRARNGSGSTPVRHSSPSDRPAIFANRSRSIAGSTMNPSAPDPSNIIARLTIISRLSGSAIPVGLFRQGSAKGLAWAERIFNLQASPTTRLPRDPGREAKRWINLLSFTAPGLYRTDSCGIWLRLYSKTCSRLSMLVPSLAWRNST